MSNVILMAYDYRKVDVETLKLILHPVDNRPVTLVYGTSLAGSVLAQADIYTWNQDKVSQQPLEAEKAADLWLKITSPQSASQRGRIMRRLLMIF